MATSSTEELLEVEVAVFNDGVIELQRLALPVRTPGQIDIDISAAAICGSDLHTVLGHRSAPPRTALGHEGVGLIRAIDPGATDLRGAPLRPGDKVVFSMMSTCGTCDRCRNGLSMKCRSLLKYGHESVLVPPLATGVLANRIRLTPTVPLLRIPEETDDMIMVSAGCAVATAAAVVEAAAPTIGDAVLIFGAGAVGYYCAAMLASLGCKVAVRDPSSRRLATLTGTGAHPDSGNGRHFEIVVEASGNPVAFTEALSMVDIGGHLVGAGSVSVNSSTVTFDPAVLVTRRLRFSGVHNYAAENFRWGVDWLLAHGRALNLERLVSPPHPLSNIEGAFAEMENGTYARVVVRP